MDARAHALEGGDYMNPHVLYLERNIDVREGDKVTVPIDVAGTATDTTFYVKKVNDFRAAPIPFRACSLSYQP